LLTSNTDSIGHEKSAGFKVSDEQACKDKNTIKIKYLIGFIFNPLINKREKVKLK
jgi:hypothetical protein